MRKITVVGPELDTLGANAAFAARVPAPIAASAGVWTPFVVAQRAEGARRSWRQAALRLVRNAAVAAGLMACVPIGLVMLNGTRFAHSVTDHRNISARIALANVVRPFRLAPDVRITPLQAGLAFNALQPSRVASAGFEMIEVAPHAAPSWQTERVPADLFVSAQPDLYPGPSSRSILEASVKGFSARELAYLRALAADPSWKIFDLLARAPAVDFLGGQFTLPFGRDARAEQRPILHYKEIRGLAYAAVSRAAYHMALGQRDSAETVLRSIVSVGLAFVDNGTTLIDELIGGVIVGVGRDALQRFYVITKDPRATSPALQAPMKDQFTAPRLPWFASSGALRQQLIARAGDARALPGERFESLRILSLTSCMSVRELMFGPGADVAAAIARARLGLARFPSERALVDLETRPIRMTDAIATDGGSDPFQRLAVSAATVAGVVLQNPRMPACTRMLTGFGSR